MRFGAETDWNIHRSAVCYGIESSLIWRKRLVRRWKHLVAIFPTSLVISSLSDWSINFPQKRKWRHDSAKLWRHGASGFDGRSCNTLEIDFVETENIVSVSLWAWSPLHVHRRQTKRESFLFTALTLPAKPQYMTVTRLDLMPGNSFLDPGFVLIIGIRKKIAHD